MKSTDNPLNSSRWRTQRRLPFSIRRRLAETRNSGVATTMVHGSVRLTADPAQFPRPCVLPQKLPRTEAHLASAEGREIRFGRAAEEIHLKVVGGEIRWRLAAQESRSLFVEIRAVLCASDRCAD